MEKVPKYNREFSRKHAQSWKKVISDIKKSHNVMCDASFKIRLKQAWLLILGEKYK